MQKKKSNGCLIALCVIAGIFVTFIVAGVACVGCVGSALNEAQNTTEEVKQVGNTEKENESSSSKEQSVYDVGSVIETEEWKISYVSADIYESDNEYIEPKEGYVYWRMEFEFENIGDSDDLASMYDFHCYADDYDMEYAYTGADDDLSATLSAGKKAKGAVYYEVPQDATEIILEYKLDYFTEQVITFKVK